MTSTIDQLSFPARALRYFKDKDVSALKKLLALFAVLYVVSPVDAVPDVIPLMGWLDDVGVLGAMSWFFVREINSYKKHPTIDAVPREEATNKSRF